MDSQHAPALPPAPPPRRRWWQRAVRICGLLVLLGVAAALVLLLTLPDTSRLATENPTETAFLRHWVDKRHAANLDATVAPIRWRSLSRIARELQRAVVISEDDTFFLHHGFNWDEMQESLDRDLEKGKLARGGSTITMQLARNLYLSPSKNPLRKVREALITVKLERDLEKKRILEIYLNVIEWGDGIYGIENAARHYFGKGAAELTEDEAAWLGACIPNPHRFNPSKITPGLRKRHDRLLDRMRRYHVDGLD